MPFDSLYILTPGEYAGWFAFALAIGAVGKSAWDRLVWGRDPRNARLVERERLASLLLRDARRDLARESKYADLLLSDPEFYRAERSVVVAEAARRPYPQSIRVFDVMA